MSQQIRANKLQSSWKRTQKATDRQHHTTTPGSYQKVCIRAISSCGWTCMQTWMQNHTTQATINVRCNNEKRERSERTKCTLMPNCWLDDLLRTLNLLPAFWQHINKLSSMRLLHFQFRRRQGLTRLLYYKLFLTVRFRYIPGSWYFLTVGLYKENQYGLQNQVKIKDGFIFIPSLLKALKKISIFKLVLKKFIFSYTALRICFVYVRFLYPF